MTSNRAHDAPRPTVVKSLLIEHFTREYATTVRVARAFPPSQSGVRAHERGAPALDILGTLVREQAGVEALLAGSWKMPPSFPAAPSNWTEGLSALEDGASRVIAGLTAVPPTRMEESVPFFVAPGEVGPIGVEALLWFWLFDMVHHRGQLSVLLRMVGGRVPSIYGPSADEPWS